MARGATCDVCRRPTERIVAKVHYIPMDRKERTTHSDYSHHADIGVCCADKLLRLFNWQTRQTREEYNASRKGIKVEKVA